jgi:hypothetical protein
MLRAIAPDGRTTLVVDEGTQHGPKGPGVPGLYGSLAAIALAPDGRLVAADTTNNVLIKVGKDGSVSPFAGRPVGKLGGGQVVTDLQDLTDMAVAPDGTVAVLTKRHGTEQTLNSVSPDGAVTERPTPFDGDEPDVAVAADGTAYVSDPVARAVWRVASDGAVVPYAGPGVEAHPAALTRPTALALDRESRLLVADAEQIVRVDASGPATVVATGVKPALDMTVLPDGSLLAVPTFERSFDPRPVTRLVLGQAPEAWAPGVVLRYPMAIAAGADGTVYASDDAGQVRRFRSTGQADVVLNLSTDPLATLQGKGFGVLDQSPPPRPRFGAIALDAAGRLYVSDIGLNRVIEVGGR